MNPCGAFSPPAAVSKPSCLVAVDIDEYAHDHQDRDETTTEEHETVVTVPCQLRDTRTDQQDRGTFPTEPRDNREVDDGPTEPTRQGG